MALQSSEVLPDNTLEEFRIEFNKLVTDVSGLSLGNTFTSQLIFEGATDDAFETVFLITDPTADKTITFPDTTGNVLLDTANITLGDNLELQLGAGPDLRIFHNGSNSIIRDTGTGALFLEGDTVSIRDEASGETMANFASDGAVTLFHNNVAKLATASTGVEVSSSGNTQIGITSTSGIGSMEIGSAASNAAFIDLKTPTSDDFDVRLSSLSGGAGGSLTIAGGTFSILGSAEAMATFADDGAVSLYHNNVVKLATAATGVTMTGEVTATGFTGTLDGILGSGAAAAATTTTLDTSGVVNLNLVTDSTSSTSGALIIDGGVGVAKKLFVGTDLDVSGNSVIDGTTLMTGVATHGGNVISDTDSTDDLGTTGVRWANLFVDAITATDQITATGFTGTLDGILGSGAAAAATVTTLNTSGVVNLNLTTESSSSTSGALIIDGGVGVAKKLFVGTDFDVSGNSVIDGTALVTGVATFGDDVVSDTDSTDDLGTTGVRWANLFVDAITTTGEITAAGFTGTLDGILGSGAAAAATTTTLASTAITASGIIKTDDTTAATSTTDGSLQTDGGLSVAGDAVIGDDLLLLSDGAIMSFGANSEIVLTHVHNVGLQFSDSDQLRFGAGGDLAIYHDGSNSYIDENGTGQLVIRSDQGILFKKYSADEKVFEATADGSVILYFNNGAKLETASGGVTITGEATATGFTGTLDGILGSGTAAAATVTTLNTSGAVVLNEAGADVDFRVEGDADPHLIFADASVDRVGIGGADTSLFNGAGTNVKLAVIGSSNNTNLVQNGVAAIAIVNTDQTDENTAGLHFARADTDDTPNYAGASIVAQFKEAQATGQYPSATLNFLTSSAQNSAPSTKMTLEQGGNLALLTDDSVLKFGANADVTLGHVHNVGLTLRGTGTGDATPIVLRLATGEADLAANNVLGKIVFQAPNEGTGTDALLDAAAIQAVSEGDFSSSSNATRLEFMTGASEAAATKMTLTSAGKLGIGTIFPVHPLTIVTAASAGVFTPALMVANNLADNDSVAGLCFHTRHDNNASGFKAAIVLDGDDNSNATGVLKFLCSNEANIANPATLAAHSRMQITPAGVVSIGGTNVTAKLNVVGQGGSNVQLQNNIVTGTGGMVQIGFINDNGLVGSIQTNGTGTSYVTSSDYRLKENIDYTWNATTRLKKLKPARFNFITDAEKTFDGFLAHEAQAVVPEAVTGTKDEVDDDGNPVMQGIDQSKLVPLLVKTIQELEARITALE